MNASSHHRQSVLFVCLGNICRSPTAQGVFEHIAAEQGVRDDFVVDSCGTGDWHIGHPPDRRATAAAAERGIDLRHLRARQFERRDFERFDTILAMDAQNLSDIRAMQPADFAGVCDLQLRFAPATGPQFSALEEVPDPYYGGDQGFDDVLTMLEQSSQALLDKLLGR